MSTMNKGMQSRPDGVSGAKRALSTDQAGFTLVELITVVVCVVILAALLLLYRR